MVSSCKPAPCVADYTMSNRVILSETIAMSIFPWAEGAFHGSIGRGFMHRLTANGHMIYTEAVEITLWRRKAWG